MSFYKPRLEQINGAKEMRAELDKIIQSYEARKVITTIPLKDTDENAVENAVYDANTLLTWLVTRIKGLSELQNTSAALVDARLKQFEDKLVKDTVRIQLSATWASDHYAVTLPGNFETLVPDVESDKLPAYYLDNTPVLDANGNNIKFSISQLAFDGVVSELDVITSAKATDGTKVYSPKQQSFEFKVFPVGKFKLSTLPEDYMLDNDELQAIAYQSAIDKIVVQLAHDEELISDIKELIGAKAIQELIQKEDEALRKDIAAYQKVDADARQAIIDNFNARHVYVPDINVPKTQVFELAEAPTTEFVLNEKPNGSRISLNINGISYDEEADAFIIDRETKTISWIGGPDNGGFDLTNEIARKVIVHYYTNGRLEKDVEETTTPQTSAPDPTPTTEEPAPSTEPEPTSEPEPTPEPDPEPTPEPDPEEQTED